MTEFDPDRYEGGGNEANGIGCFVIGAILTGGFLLWFAKSKGLPKALRGVSDLLSDLVNLVGGMFGDVDFMRSTEGIMVTGMLMMFGTACGIAVVRGISRRAYPKLFASYYAIYGSTSRAAKATHSYLKWTSVGLIALGMVWFAIWLNFVF